jgi:hypothetical protein
MRERRGSYRVLLGKLVGSKHLGRPRRSWVNNIRMNLRVVGWGMSGIRTGALVNAVMKFRVA